MTRGAQHERLRPATSTANIRHQELRKLPQPERSRCRCTSFVNNISLMHIFKLVRHCHADRTDTAGILPKNSSHPSSSSHCGAHDGLSNGTGGAQSLRPMNTLIGQDVVSGVLRICFCGVSEVLCRFFRRSEGSFNGRRGAQINSHPKSQQLDQHIGYQDGLLGPLIPITNSIQGHF